MSLEQGAAFFKKLRVWCESNNEVLCEKEKSLISFQSKISDECYLYQSIHTQRHKNSAGTSNDTCLFLIPRAGQVHHPRIEQTGSICHVKMTKVKNSSWINIDMHIHRKTGLTNFTFSFLQIKNLISYAPTKVICGRVKVLLRWGAGDGQSPAEATVVHHHIQQDMRGHHLHHRIHRPNRQVRAILQRFARSDNNRQEQWKARFSLVYWRFPLDTARL